MTDLLNSGTLINLLPSLQANLFPRGLSTFPWVVIGIVLYLINVIISAKALKPAGKPDSTKAGRIKQAFILTVILSWALLFLIAHTLTEQGKSSNSMGIVGAVAGWVFFILLGFVANWKLFETYFPMRQKLGGSDAYANLHRHLWGHLLALVAAVIAALGVFIWRVIG